MAAHAISASKSRLKTMLVPREHGAWGMMLVPMATGAVVAARARVDGSALLLLVIASLAAFWMRTPLEAWLGTSAIKAQTRGERRAVQQATVLLALVVLASIAALFAKGYARGLVGLAVISAAAFAAQALVKKIGRKGRMPAQMIGAIGLTSTAAGAYYVATGSLDRTAIVLWVANWIFACDQIHFVQVRVHSARLESWRETLKLGMFFLLGQLLLIPALVAAIAAHLAPWLMAIAFAPALARGLFWFVRGRQPLNLHKLGFSELAHAALFGALLSAAYVL
jgi:hypothetical protein